MNSYDVFKVNADAIPCTIVYGPLSCHMHHMVWIQKKSQVLFFLAFMQPGFGTSFIKAILKNHWTV